MTNFMFRFYVWNGDSGIGSYELALQEISQSQIKCYYKDKGSDGEFDKLMVIDLDANGNVSSITLYDDKAGTNEVEKYTIIAL
jgi:hypothetical protein